MMSGELTLGQQLATYRNELNTELTNILDYWIDNTQDNIEGGFLGRIDNYNNVVPGSPKGSVLNARILWSFSAAFNFIGKTEYLDIADRAYQYVISHIIDKTYGGVYWSVDHDWTAHLINDTVSKTKVDFTQSTFKIRDLWSKKDLGTTQKPFKQVIPASDVVMVRLSKQ